METEKAFEAYSAIPRDHLAASACVDLLLLLACGKSAVRTVLRNTGDQGAIAYWCDTYGFYCEVDDQRYLSIAANKDLARLVLEVDRRSEPHVAELGLLLGYPACCCHHVEEIGEANIDRFATEVYTWVFEGAFQIIDPSMYHWGKALISHLPCSPYCIPSLAIAESAKHFVAAHRDKPVFTTLVSWLEERGA